MRSHPVLVHSRTTAAQPKCHNIHSNVIYCNTRSYQQMASYTAAVHPPPSTIGRCVCVCRCENHCYCDGATQHIVRVTFMCVCIMHSVDVLWCVCSRARAHHHPSNVVVPSSFFSSMNANAGRNTRLCWLTAPVGLKHSREIIPFACQKSFCCMWGVTSDPNCDKLRPARNQQINRSKSFSV